MKHDIFQLVSTAARLKEIHKTAQGLYSDFALRVDYHGPALRQLAAQKHGGNIMAAAIELTMDPKQDPRLTMLLLAVAVELIERDKAKPVAPRRPNRIWDNQEDSQ